MDRSARAVARNEKTLQEHELYVEALLAGTILPPRRRQPEWRVTLALGAVAATAISALVLLAVLRADDQLDKRGGGEGQKPRATGPAREPSTAERSGAPVIAREAALRGAIISARQLYLDTTMVSRFQRRHEKPSITGGGCDPPKAGVYWCRIFEKLSDQKMSWGWTTEWEVTIDDQACWTALPVPPPDGHTMNPKGVRNTISTQGTGDAAPLNGCLRDNGRP